MIVADYYWSDGFFSLITIFEKLYLYRMKKPIVIRIRPQDDIKNRCGGKTGGCTLTDFYINCKKAA